MLVSQKKSLRTHFSALRRGVTESQRREAGEAISKKLLSLPCLAESRSIAAFFPSSFEPDISPFILSALSDGKRIFFPKSAKDGTKYEMAEPGSYPHGFAKGAYGVMEPGDDSVKASNADLESSPWLVPGLAFDKVGGRLGHGLGVYDRLLEHVKSKKIGLCFAFQIAEAVPADDRDVRMDLLATEYEIIKCNKTRSIVK